MCRTAWIITNETLDAEVPLREAVREGRHSCVYQNPDGLQLGELLDQAGDWKEVLGGVAVDARREDLPDVGGDAEGRVAVEEGRGGDRDEQRGRHARTF